MPELLSQRGKPLPYGFALRVVLTPRDVGTRVVVRRTLPDGRLGDVLGQLVAWTRGVLTIRTRTGALVQVDEATVVAGKPVPPPPRLTPRRSAGATGSERPLAEVAADGWPGIERVELGGWRLQAAAGWTARANSVVPIPVPERPVPERPVPERPLDDALAVVREWYAARGLVARFQVDLADPLDRELERRGWRRRDPEEEVLVQTAPAAALLDAAAGSPATVTLHREPSAGWLDCYRRAAEAPAAARAVLTSPAGAVTFAAVEEDGRVLAVARGVVLHGWLGVAALEVDPDARRRGLGGAVLARLGAHAQEQGASRTYVQVTAANAGARALYERLGFRTAYGYAYREAATS